MRIHRFIRLLRLCTSTFQSFIDLPRNAAFPSEIGKGMSPWLLQESFNAICAATNAVVEECVVLTSSFPHEQEKMMTGVLDLLLHVLTTPQSSVTHLRALGGALQALEQFGVSFFLEITGASLQHWVRVVLSLMNSISLSVRSIAVDLVVSLLGNAFDVDGNIDDLAVVFVTVLPEVAAREIGLFSVSGLISDASDVAKTVWPLRRSIADLEDANPLDDDRVDPQLPPILSVFCRSCQAVLDGLLIELNLKGGLSIVGTQIARGNTIGSSFDADEESLFEAADFFVPEIGPLQRLRWLLTLAALHEAKCQWIEAAETLFLCARAITDSIPHLRSIWRPSRFDLWSDPRRSLWLETVGEDVGRPDQGNAQVMGFADKFLEPTSVFKSSSSSTGRLDQPTFELMCSKLTETVKKAVSLYLREEGTDELAYSRLEALQKSLLSVLDERTAQGSAHGISPRSLSPSSRKRHVGAEADLRKVLASISGEVTRLAERLLLSVQDEPRESSRKPELEHQTCFVLLRLSGRKPIRFQESTALPTFLEWDSPCICRVPWSIVHKVSQSKVDFSRLCRAFAEPYLKALQSECGVDGVVLRTTADDPEAPVDDKKTILHAFPVEIVDTATSGISTLVAKRFFYRTPKAMMELTVAHPFPCALSRQKVLLQSEILSPTGNTRFFPE